MDNKVIIALIIVVACCAIGGLIYAGSVGTQSDNNDTVNNTTNTTNTTNETNITNETNETVSQSQESQNKQHSSDSSASKSSSQETYQDPHSDWVCEGDTWYSKKIGDGSYALYDKSSGHMIGTGDMPDRHGYHGQEYVDKYSSTVKYRSNGEYYEG